MFISLALIFILGSLGGYIFEKIKLPKLIFYLLLGILLGPLLNVLDASLLNLSSFLRKVALVIILMRSGMSIDFKKIKENGVLAVLLSFMPAVFEIVAIAFSSHFLLKLDIVEGLLLGSVIAAVSPAVLVPRMIKIKNEGYGNDKGVADTLLCASSLDDIFVIVFFYGFLNLSKTNSFELTTLLNIPLSIILGFALGYLSSFLMKFIFKYFKVTITLKVITTLGVAFFLIYLEDSLKKIVDVSSLIAIISLAYYTFKKDDTKEHIQKGYNALWEVFEILLFVLVGAALDLSHILSIETLNIILVILLGVIIRSVGTFLATLCSKLNRKEKLFVVLSYLPKATVQASIGGICLSEGLKAGSTILLGAVISILLMAPLGALLIDKSYKKLLNKS